MEDFFYLPLTICTVSGFNKTARFPKTSSIKPHKPLSKVSGKFHSLCVFKLETFLIIYTIPFLLLWMHFSVGFELFIYFLLVSSFVLNRFFVVIQCFPVSGGLLLSGKHCLRKFTSDKEDSSLASYFETGGMHRESVKEGEIFIVKYFY